MATNSKRKGNSYELKIAKKMTEWTGLKFERVPASGGLHWRKDNRVYGDIVTNEPGFKYVVECKNREKWNMDNLFKGSAEVEKWWEQVTKDAVATGKQRMVIFTRNQQPDYIMLSLETFNEIEFIHEYIDLDYIKKTVGGVSVIVMQLDEFIERALYK